MVNHKGDRENAQLQGIDVSDTQIEIFARRLLPEIKRFFANENIRQEFKEWQRERHKAKQ